MNELKRIHKIVTKEIEEWSQRIGKKLKPPYPGDSSCYYCTLYSEESCGKNVCDYCIQNPEAKIYKDIEENFKK